MRAFAVDKVTLTRILNLGLVGSLRSHEESWIWIMCAINGRSIVHKD